MISATINIAEGHATALTHHPHRHLDLLLPSEPLTEYINSSSSKIDQQLYTNDHLPMI
jgi:hypothetical protein